MLKQVFLEKLGKALSGLPQEDIEERLAFYSEMVDDRMEEGYLEEEAVDAIGPVEEIAAHIVADVPLTKIVKEKVTAGKFVVFFSRKRLINTISAHGFHP